MKVVVILQDTPKGVYPEVRWRGNGCCDNPMDSISLHLVTTFVKQFEELEKSGVIRLDRDEPTEAGA
jgi:hypothetical protein